MNGGLSGAALSATTQALKRLGLRVGPMRLEAACARGIAMGDVSVARLRSMLNRGLEQTDPRASLAASHTSPDNANVRGATYFEKVAS